MNKCYECIHSLEVPGNSHIRCANPDPDMTGNDRAKQKGWFYYPMLFDPVWMTKECANYKSELTPVSGAISQAA